MKKFLWNSICFRLFLFLSYLGFSNKSNAHTNLKDNSVAWELGELTISTVHRQRGIHGSFVSTLLYRQACWCSEAVSWCHLNCHRWSRDWHLSTWSDIIKGRVSSFFLIYLYLKTLFFSLSLLLPLTHTISQFNFNTSVENGEFPLLLTYNVNIVIIICPFISPAFFISENHYNLWVRKKTSCVTWN